MRVYNIDWETDGYDVDLPKEVELPKEVLEEEDFTPHCIADYLSDEYGFLVNSFDYEC